MDIRAKPFSFPNRRAGLDAIRFRLIAGGDTACGIDKRGRNSNRLATEMRAALLLNG